MKSLQLVSAKGVRWFCSGVFSLVLLGSLPLLHHSPDSPVSSSRREPLSIPVNSVNSFSYVHFDPDQNGNPLWGISFDSMVTQNGDAGVFKTAMRRTLHIKGLQLCCYDYVADTSDSSPDPSHSTVLAEAIGTLQGGLFGFQSGQPDNEFGSLHLGVDFRNLTKLFVQGFRFDEYVNGTPRLRIESGIAQTMGHTQGLVLRGHVMISDSNGTLLESNHVVWDMKNELLIAKGLYALRRDGISATGRDICVDMKLNEISVSKNQPSDEKESLPCYAQALSF